MNKDTFELMNKMMVELDVKEFNENFENLKSNLNAQKIPKEQLDILMDSCVSHFEAQKMLIDQGIEKVERFKRHYPESEADEKNRNLDELKDKFINLSLDKVENESIKDALKNVNVSDLLNNNIKVTDLSSLIVRKSQ